MPSNKKLINLPFFLSIVLPSLVAMGLFIGSVFIFVLPAFETTVMDKKREMIRELTNSFWSLIEEYDNENISREEAQKQVVARIKQIRYGTESKDYFWIIDKQPKMIMHPYRQDLLSTDLGKYEDPNGKKIFVEAVKIVEQKGDGFIDYMWQWKDDSTRIVPKLSYVRLYEPWGWIIGTGIYLDDVQAEISNLKKSLAKIALLIATVIFLMILYVIRASLKIENSRRDTEAKLALSMQKYKSLVEASTEGTLLVVNQRIVFANSVFCDLVGYNEIDILKLKFADIFGIEWETLQNLNGALNLETTVLCNDKTKRAVIASISLLKQGEQDGYIVVTKEVSDTKQIQLACEQLSQELQTSLLLMNQPIKHYLYKICKCDADTAVQQAALLMTKQGKDVLFVSKDQQIIGVINNSDLKKRVLAKGLDPSTSVVNIMTAPVECIDAKALLYEAILLQKDKNVSHLAVRNEQGTIVETIGYKDIAKIHQSSVGYFIKEIELSENVDELKSVTAKLPALVSVLVESGDKTENITHIISSVSDSIVKRLIQMAFFDVGEPPCKFAFMIMGSEGRMEQTLSTDQDNAIVYENVDASQEKSAQEYFLELGKIVCENLNTVGYRLCDGEIMASNPEWVQSLQEWEKKFGKWIGTSDPQSILNCSIFFDFRCGYGHQLLIDQLRSYINTTLKTNSIFFYHMAKTIMDYKDPLNMFGNIKSSSNDTVNVKDILLPVMSFLRLYTLKNQLDATNSLDRAKKLHECGEINKSLYEEIVFSYNYLMNIRLRFQAADVLENKEPGNVVDLNRLTNIEVETIKKIFAQIGSLRSKLGLDYKSG